MDKMANDLDQKWRDALRYKESFTFCPEQLLWCVLFQCVFLAPLSLTLICVTYITKRSGSCYEMEFVQRSNEIIV